MTQATFDTLKDQCKARGVTLLHGKDDKGKPCFIVSQWGQFKDLPSLQAVANWLDWTHPRAKA